jgi:chromosome segregation ATPase
MDSINQQYSKRIKDETQLGEQIKSLIAREPRSLGLIAQTESAKLATSGDADIKRNIKLQSSQPENLGDTLRMLLRRRELLRRDIATPITQKDTMTQNLETTQQKLASAQKKRNRIKDQVDQYQSINNNLWKRTIVM